jgi:hypothetical protein
MVAPSPSDGHIPQASHHLHAIGLGRSVPILVKAPVTAVVKLVLNGPMSADQTGQPLEIGLLGTEAGQVKGPVPSATIF